MNDLMLLATLLAGPQHGYALKKQAGLLSGQPAMHNNLVYPLLRRFVANGWVTQRKAPGDRGQTRQMYSLTPLGRRALLDRLAEFDESAARSPEQFHLRVGLFSVLSPATRAQILQVRKTVLELRDQKFALLQKEIDLGDYGGEVVRFLRQSLRAEVVWIGHLERISGRTKPKESKRPGRKLA
jgi:DNA-binding PadR family transcriptional regulator